VAGLLFALENVASTANTDEKECLPCTSKPCEWNKPGKRKRETSSVDNINFKKMRYGRDDEKIEKKTNYRVLKNGEQDFLSTLCGKLQTSDAVLLDIVSHTGVNTDVAGELNVGCYEEVISSTRQTMDSDRYIDLKKTIREEQINNEGKFDELVSGVPDSVIEEVEYRTRGQSSNPLWNTTRALRITSSNFHDVLTRKQSTDPAVLIKKFTSETGVDPDNRVQSLKWGRTKEPIAKKKFIAYKKLKYKETVKVQDCGIFLSKNKCYLGASPDGIITSDSEKRLLEIKCPYKWRNSSVSGACKDKTFYCFMDDTNGQIQLKKSHRYCTQIQGQMAICNYNMCDLVIYTNVDIKIISVQFDKSFWETMEAKLHGFYTQHIIPFALSLCK